MNIINEIRQRVESPLARIRLWQRRSHVNGCSTVDIHLVTPDGTGNHPSPIDAHDFIDDLFSKQHQLTILLYEIDQLKALNQQLVRALESVVPHPMTDIMVQNGGWVPLKTLVEAGISDVGTMKMSGEAMLHAWGLLNEMRDKKK